MTVNIIEVSNKVDNIINDLFVSMEKERVEDVFSKNGIEDRNERIQLLRKCMQVLDVSNSHNSLSPDDAYSDELAIFLDGTWRFLI